MKCSSLQNLKLLLHFSATPSYPDHPVLFVEIEEHRKPRKYIRVSLLVYRKLTNFSTRSISNFCWKEFLEKWAIFFTN
uniref:Uncharacterized protein n=1 Tax=Rhizophora mucronata TaxID=61149 RepID=A0A2P2QBJ4_RHIMU